MSRPAPALIRAELLARMHYGLPPIPAALTGRPRGVYRMILARLDDSGFVDDGRLTELAYLELKEVCRKVKKMKNSRWYKEGVEARKAGPIPACPYSEKSPKALIWLEGFNASACSLGSACNCGGDRERCPNWVPQI